MKTQQELPLQSSYDFGAIQRSTAYLKAEESWKDIVPREVAYGIIKQGFLSPTRIQSKAISASLDLKNWISILQSQNGSGKTLAFLLLIHLRIQKIGPFKYKADPLIFSPQAMIVAPSIDVGMQILSAAKMLEELFPEIKVGILTTKDTKRTITKCQVLIGTPSTLDWGLHHEILYLNKLKVLVIDEADFILSNSPGSETVIKIAQSMTLSDQQVFFFSADFTKKSIELIDSLKRPEYKVHKSLLPAILRMPPGIAHYYIVSRDRGLMEKILNLTAPLTQSLIFVNSRDQAKGFCTRLVRKKLRVKFLVGEHESSKSEVHMSVCERKAAISAFSGNEIGTLVTTDILARGFDSRNVRLVINWQLPMTHEEKDPSSLDVGLYLHRAGRTGRFGETGIVLNILENPKDRESIQVIEDTYSLRITEIDSIEQIGSLFKKELDFMDYIRVLDE